MPIYEYKCRECGDKFENLVRSPNSQEDPTCPVCNSPKVERRVSVCGCLGSAHIDSGASSVSSSACAPSGGG
jgi:putative FmdB family regulatory protein